MAKGNKKERKKITIYPPKKSNSKAMKKWLDIEEEGILPLHPFHMTLIAPPKSGKSCLILNLLYNPDINYKKRFDNVIFISPTILGDKTLKTVKNDDDIIKIHEDLKHLDDILATILKEQLDHGEDTLIILDDCISNLRGDVGFFSAKYRHYNCSLIIVSQQYKSISPISRNSSSHFAMFSTYNKKELEKMGEELSSFPDFLEHFKYATKERYNFLYIDTENQRIMKNFNEILWER